jgi:hypothetical protein
MVSLHPSGCPLHNNSRIYSPNHSLLQHSSDYATLSACNSQTTVATTSDLQTHSYSKSSQPLSTKIQPSELLLRFSLPPFHSLPTAATGSFLSLFLLSTHFWCHSSCRTQCCKFRTSAASARGRIRCSSYALPPVFNPFPIEWNGLPCITQELTVTHCISRSSTHLRHAPAPQPAHGHRSSYGLPPHFNPSAIQCRGLPSECWDHGRRSSILRMLLRMHSPSRIRSLSLLPFAVCRRWFIHASDAFVIICVLVIRISTLLSSHCIPFAATINAWLPLSFALLSSDDAFFRIHHTAPR